MSATFPLQAIDADRNAPWGSALLVPLPAGLLDRRPDPVAEADTEALMAEIKQTIAGMVPVAVGNGFLCKSIVRKGVA